MTNPISLKLLLVQTLDRELLDRGLQLSGVARTAVEAKLFQALSRLAPPGPCGGSLAIPVGVLEAALGEATANFTVGAYSEHAILDAQLEIASVPSDDPALSQIEEALVRLRSASTDSVGEIIDGKYRIEELLAEGGFGRVYRARDLDLDCEVAVKFLKAAGGYQGDQRLADFREEARRLTKLSHPGIVEWKTLNQTSDGRMYLVMEYLEGEELEQTLQREGCLGHERVARILYEIIVALRHAHELPDGSSLLHLDLKPSNVFLIQDGRGEERVKLLDYGISQFAGRESRVGARVEGTPENFDLGETTSVVGRQGGGPGLACTPLYCSPELAARILGPGDGKPLDGRADLYALGLLGYRMLTGRTPFESSSSLVGMLVSHRDSVPSPVRTQDARIPKALARFIDQCLEKNPEDRFPSTQVAHEELRRVVEPRRRARFAFSLAAIALIILGSFKAWGASASAPPQSAVVAGTHESLGGATFYFGPAAQQARVAFPELSWAEEGAPVIRLLRAPRVDAALVEGWRVSAEGRREAALRVDVSGLADHAVCFLEISLEGERRYSNPFELIYVPEASWEIASVSIPDRGARMLAPSEQYLEILASGRTEFLGSTAKVYFGGDSYFAQRDEAVSDAEHFRYRLALDSLVLPEGRCTLEVELADLAGGLKALPLTFTTVLSPLSVSTLDLRGVPRSRGTWQLLVGEAAEVELTTNRLANLSWRVEDENGLLLKSGRSSGGALRHRVDLLSESWAGASLEGSIHIQLEEAPWVSHAPGATSGTCAAILNFEVNSVGAEFNISITGARERQQAELPGVVHYVGAGAFPLVVYRDHDTPMSVSVSCAPEEGGAEVAELPSLRFQSHQELRRSLVLPVVQDGRYRLVAEGRRLDPTGAPLEASDEEQSLVVVRDTEAPLISLAGWKDSSVIRSIAQLRELFLAVQVEDTTWTPAPPDVLVNWSLRAGTSPSTAWNVGGEFALLDSLTLSLESLILSADPSRKALQLPEDGSFELWLQAQDFAGNSGKQKIVGWSVSATGPRLKVVAPADGDSWARFDGRFVVELEAGDANGTSSVSGRIEDPSGELDPLEFTLVSTASDSDDSHWTGYLDLDHRWSERSVRLHFTGVDSLGTPSLSPIVVDCRLAMIPNSVPAKIIHTYLGRGAAPMRRVTGNDGGDYFLGGRGDAAENAAFRAAGLQDFSDGNLVNSLRIRIPRGVLQGYYVDEYEVSVGQFLEFLRESPAYGKEGSPRPASELGEDRRLAQLKRLATVAPDLPVTGVTLEEAHAYALWVGKELPTYLQWEYAVRGLARRPFSFYRDSSSFEAASVNVAGVGPWPCASGEDRTPDSGIANLCSNVAEWTSTPAAARLVDCSLKELLDGASPSVGGRFYAVGGSYRRRPVHFGVVQRISHTRASEAVGFRCVLSAAAVDAAYLDIQNDHLVVPQP